jgi:hypothetical protein
MISDEVASSFDEVMFDEVVFLGGFYRFGGRFASGMKRELAVGDSLARFGFGEIRVFLAAENHCSLSDKIRSPCSPYRRALLRWL